MVTRGSKDCQTHPYEQATTETLKDVGLHVLPCSLPPFIGERVFSAFCPEPRAVPVHTIFALLCVRWTNLGQNLPLSFLLIMVP